jgi:hypothetical protein
MALQDIKLTGLKFITTHEPEFSEAMFGIFAAARWIWPGNTIMSIAASGDIAPILAAVCRWRE